MSLHKQFKCIFLNHLLKLLDNEDELEQARKGFQQNDEHHERYLCRFTFGLQNWKAEDAAQLSAAIAEALRQTTLEFFTTAESKLRLIQEITDNIKNQLLPGLISSIDAINPLGEMKDKIRRELEALKNEATYFNNPYVLFGGLAATAVITTVAWSLSKKSP
ncbi:hypothetical protein EAS68_00630 [Legionella jordanis]|uniref:hypothetical protein n=1 Tax=Legionella jordanis TaxID=456 RepID=UPI000EFFAAB3|nr:hypothetical protein [Legionella jordanis]RMX22069.1 hypothetical protein EAS68_00630 [Legionella jordanis]